MDGMNPGIRKLKSASLACCCLGAKKGHLYCPCEERRRLPILPEPNGFDGCGDTLEEMATYTREQMQEYAWQAVQQVELK